MKVSIDKNFIETLRGSKGQLKVSLHEVEKIYRLLESDHCRAIIMDKMCFLVFDEIINVELAIEDYRHQKDLSFIESKHLEIINTTSTDKGYLVFLFNEAFQGKGVLARLRRFIGLVTLLAGLNILGYLYGDTTAIGNVFTGLLAAVSIFIAIFSLFVTSHDYMTRKKVHLFESGQLNYYFSVDKHVTRTGIIAIILSVYGLVLTSGDGTGTLYTTDTQNILIILALNLTFVLVYIILRSMVEFYIIRPGKFIMADMKLQSLSDYRKSKE